MRRYRDSVVFVAMNRGNSVTIEEVETELPDGEHTEVLSRRKFEVKDGKLYNLELGSREVMIFSRVESELRQKLSCGRSLTTFKLSLVKELW